jgi:hypothetical protein
VTVDRGQRAGMLRCGLAALLFGASTPLAARVADDVSAFTLAGLLYLGAAGAVAPLVLGPGRHDPGVVGAGWPWPWGWVAPSVHCCSWPAWPGRRRRPPRCC